ncbi:cyclic pyranopterin monophosphate synthase MoaC [soil metagenome]
MVPDELTHIAPDGSARMVDISEKPRSARAAVATAFIHLLPDTLRRIRENQLKKGDVLGVARIAAISAAKQTAHLIPLCHQIPLSSIDTQFHLDPEGIRVTTTAKSTGQTGVEMEALTAASVAALTIYDMCKAVDPSMRITDLHLVSKKKTPA